MTDDVETIFEFDKNRREKVRVSLNTFRGHRLVGIRVWFDPQDGSDLRPGNSGLSLRVDRIGALQKALEAAAQAAKASGWLE